MTLSEFFSRLSSQPREHDRASLSHCHAGKQLEIFILVTQYDRTSAYRGDNPF